MVEFIWPVEQATLASELTQFADIANKWQERFTSREWCEAMESAPQLQRQILFQQFANELKVAASKAAALIEVVS